MGSTGQAIPRTAGGHGATVSAQQGGRVELNLPFLGHALNAVDAKGRVSVPAAFRNVFDRRRRLIDGAADGDRNELMIGLHEAGDRLVALDSLAQQQLQGELRETVSEMPARERRTMLSASKSDELGPLSSVMFDGAGRMVLTPMLRRFGAIGDLALFWGTGDSFEIWNPDHARAAFADSPRSLMTLDYLLEERGVKP